MATSIMTSSRPLSVRRLSRRPHSKLSPGQSPTMMRMRLAVPNDATSDIVDGHTSRGDERRTPDERGLSPRRMRINVSGQVYETRADVFDAHPDTIFGDPVKRSSYWDAQRQEYFFDRHRPSFEAVFTHIAEGGRLTRPRDIPVDVFLNEVAFYDFNPEVIAELKHVEGMIDDVRPMPVGRLQRAVWMLFEYPDTSTAAQAVAIVSVTVTMIAIISLCLETMPYFASSRSCGTDGDVYEDGSVGDRDKHRAMTSSLSLVGNVDPFFIIETLCIAWFTLELAIRFACCPSKYAFWKDFKNHIDVASMLPYYIDVLIRQSDIRCVTAVTSSYSGSPSLSYLRVIRLARVFKLTKHCVGLQVLIETFKASFSGLGMFMLTLSVCVLIYSSALYYAEQHVPESSIRSIPDAFWWAIITMTTVGYGDAVPVGWLGRIIGTACAVSGILTLAIPVPIIAGHFNRFYAGMTGRHHHVA